MYIRIGSFSKRHNSTKQPAANWGTSLNVDLKEDCSMEEPIFKLGFTAWDPSYNYIYVTAWNRYYFVVNVTVNIGRIWEVQCKLDTAGTYKTDIQNMSAFVLYASGSNTEIVDSRLSIKTTPTHAVGGGAGFPHVSQYGSYVVSVVGEYNTGQFVLNITQLRELFSRISSWSNVEMPLPTLQADQTAMMKEAGETIVKALRQIIATGSAGENIRAATFIPLIPSAFEGKTTERRIYLGQYNTNMQADYLTERHFSESITINIPWQATGWRRNAPYHELYLVIPTLGVITLSPSDLIDCDSITVELSMDLVSGNAKIIVFAGNLNRQIGIYDVNYAAEYPIGSSNVPLLNSATSILGGAAGAASALHTGGIAGALMGAGWLSGIMNNIVPQTMSVGGSNGNAAIGADVRIWIYSIFHDTVVDPDSVSAVMGVPKMQTMSLSNQSGYVQTQNASVQGDNMSDAARQEINAMCDGGIYIE